MKNTLKKWFRGAIGITITFFSIEYLNSFGFVTIPDIIIGWVCCSVYQIITKEYEK